MIEVGCPSCEIQNDKFIVSQRKIHTQHKESIEHRNKLFSRRIRPELVKRSDFSGYQIKHSAFHIFGKGSAKYFSSNCQRLCGFIGYEIDRYNHSYD